MTKLEMIQGRYYYPNSKMTFCQEINGRKLPKRDKAASQVGTDQPCDATMNCGRSATEHCREDIFDHCLPMSGDESSQDFVCDLYRYSEHMYYSVGERDLRI